MVEGRPPTLPSGSAYRRAKPYTAAVAAVFDRWGVSETTARMPSVVCGVLLVLVTVWVGTRWFGPWEGLLAGLLVAVAPLAVETSRICRMYAAFATLYLLMLSAWFEATERCNLSRWKRVGWLVAAAGLAWMSRRMHLLTVDALPPLFAFWTAMAWRKPLYRWRLLAAGALGAALVMGGWLDPMALYRRANEVPGWAVGTRYVYDFYWTRLHQAYPWLWLALPFALGWLLRHRHRLGLFLACQLMVPLALHSFVYDWKAPRYIAHLMPLLALALAPAGVALLRWMAVSMGPMSARLLAMPTWTLLRFGVATAALALVAVVTPSIHRSVAVWNDPIRLDWRRAYSYISHRQRPNDAIVASIPLAAQYYGGHAEYVVNNTLLERGHRMRRTPDGHWLDWYSGLPLVTDVKDFVHAQARHPRAWLVADRHRFEWSRAMPPDLHQYIRSRCREHTVVPSGSILVFECAPDIAPMTATNPKPGST